MKHSHYYQVKAQTHFELGFKLAQLFKTSSLDIYSSILKKISHQKPVLKESKEYLSVTEKYFPEYIEELKGYANGMEVDFDNFWLTFLSEELNIYPGKCTSCFSSDGMIIGHNEDNLPYFEKSISIIEKTIGEVSMFELYYHNSLGGSACSINSHGFVQTINTLHHIDQQIGVPRNIIARWLSETSDPENDFRKMQKIKRAMGYCHTFCSVKGPLFNIESSAQKSYMVKPGFPYVHTNHYLTRLSKYENKTVLGNTIGRYEYAKKQIGKVKTAKDMMSLLEQIAHFHPNDTIARMVIDLRNKSVWCWLARESAQGWVEYPLQFL